MKSSYGFQIARNEGKFYSTNKQLIPDTSSVCSIYIMQGIANNSSEDYWYNCLVCFLR